MDKNRLAAFTLRGSAGNLERAINTTSAASIADPKQRQLTIARVRELAGQLAVWLEAADPKPSPAPIKPLTQRAPVPPPDADTQK
ncbi:MAG TPA: hypothetical protein VK961_06860 [Chthoniobacter sp.]|nr:hypothetical protein [Chthoniobacter sp.]